MFYCIWRKLAPEALSPALRSLIAVALLMASAAAGAQQAATPPSASSPASQAVSAAPDRSNTWTAPPGSQIAVDRPAILSSTPKLPVLLWANGECRNTSVEFTRFLGELASHGYLVIAIGR